MTCDAITQKDLSFLGGNCKIFTQIILDKMEDDIELKNYLIGRFCEAKNGFKYDKKQYKFQTRDGA